MLEMSGKAMSGETGALIALGTGLRWVALDDAVKHAVKRHVLDTFGVIIAGATGDLTQKLEEVLGRVRGPGRIPVPGRKRAADLLDAVQIAGTAGHGIELDDGYRQGSVHPGVVVVPTIAALGYERRASGRAFLEAAVVGYETVIAVARACHPDLRRRGFHPTGTTGVLGAAMASGHMLGLSPDTMANALGLAASSAAGLFAFVNGGSDVKRLHAGHAAREGLQAALLAEAGVEGPPAVIESRDGFSQAFAFGRENQARALQVPPDVPFGLPACYVKPYACCRHLQPAVEALIGLMKEHGLKAEDVENIQVETYSIAAEHAHTGWQNYASAQLSFPYIMALGLKFGWIKVAHFGDATRGSAELARYCSLVHVTATSEMDGLYPANRPARVIVKTAQGVYRKEAMEALGAPEVPLSDDGLALKFRDLVEPVVGARRTGQLLDRLWHLDEAGDLRSVIDAMVL